MILGLCLDSFTTPIKPLGTRLVFLSFKSLSQAYLVKTSMTHNKR